jgi:hypothetical protein
MKIILTNRQMLSVLKRGEVGLARDEILQASYN